MSLALVKALPWRPLAAAAGRIFDALIGAADAYAGLRQAARERAELLSLDERALHDIGISRCDAVREAERPLWRSVPVRGDEWPIGRA